MQDTHTEPHWDSSALIIIDMQNGFVSPKVEKEGTKPHSVISGIQLLLNSFRDNGKAIVHVVRSYLPDGSDADVYRKGIVESGEFVLSPGSERAEIVPMLKPEDSQALDFNLLRSGVFQELGLNEWAMYKPRLGVFYNTPLEGWLRDKGIDTLVFTGTFFPNCVRMSIYEANERDFRAVAARGAIVGFYEKGEKELGAIGASCFDAKEIVSIINDEV